MNPRLRRLQSDFDLVRETFSGHPHVTVEPIGDVLPPTRYRIEMRVRGVCLVGDQPEFRDVHHIELTLPRGYPADKPYAVPLEPIFHPNIRDYFCIADYWAAGTTLAEVIVKMGDMIQWRIYNVRSPLDAIAARWAVEQEPTGIFPLGNVDLGVPDFDVEIRSGAAKAQTTGAAPPAERHPVLELAPVVDDDAGAFTPEDAYESSDEELVVIRSHG